MTVSEVRDRFGGLTLSLRCEGNGPEWLHPTGETRIKGHVLRLGRHPMGLRPPWRVGLEQASWRALVPVRSSGGTPTEDITWGEGIMDEGGQTLGVHREMMDSG